MGTLRSVGSFGGGGALCGSLGWKRCEGGDDGGGQDIVAGSMLDIWAWRAAICSGFMFFMLSCAIFIISAIEAGVSCPFWIGARLCFVSSLRTKREVLSS